LTSGAGVTGVTDFGRGEATASRACVTAAEAFSSTGRVGLPGAGGAGVGAGAASVVLEGVAGLSAAAAACTTVGLGFAVQGSDQPEPGR
jgi:hypothetical protein